VTNLGNGNSINGTATVTRGDGTNTTAAGVGVNTTAANLDLANNPFYRAFTTPVALSTQAQGLPEMRGSGWVRDLWGSCRRVARCHGRAAKPRHQPGDEHHGRDQDRATAGDCVFA